jgi:DNA-binding CsgD family transcriptional regulator
VVIETARAGDLTQVLLDSYGLTQRETEIALMLARGLSTKEIAAELILSVHTVRDHTKVIYDKAGVNTRGELVAKLFSNHVLDYFHSAVAHLS